MLAKLRSGGSQPTSPVPDSKVDISSATTHRKRKASKLKKRKPSKSSHQSDKSGSELDPSTLSDSTTSIPSATNSESEESKSAVRPHEPKRSSPSPRSAQTKGDLDSKGKAHRPTVPPIQVKPNAFFKKIPYKADKGQAFAGSDSTRTSPTDTKSAILTNGGALPKQTRRCLTGRSKKSSTDSPPTSPMSAIKRRFSYSPSSPRRASEHSLPEQDIKDLWITATRVPEFSSAYDSAVPSDAVQVTVVDHLPHQKPPSPTRSRFPTNSPRESYARKTFTNGEFDDDFLLEQQEVVLYLQNSLLGPQSPNESPKSISSDGGLPRTPPLAKTLPQQRNAPPAPSLDIIDKMISEFPQLPGDDEKVSFFETLPLHLKDKSRAHDHGLTPSASSISLGGIRPEFPPSPPQSEGRISTDQENREMLEELGFETRSMRSIIDAINRTSSAHSSFHYSDTYDNNNLFDGGDPSLFTSDGERPWTRRSDEEFDNDVDSMVSYTSPILRTGKASYAALETVDPVISRSASQVSSVSIPEEGDSPIDETINEKRRSRPELSPLVITPIAPGQYGPPLQRRKHLRGRGKLSSPMSARGGLNAVRPNLVKVVEDEVVEYTPIEEGEKGWIRQRRVSRQGDWVVVEKEILKPGAI